MIIFTKKMHKIIITDFNLVYKKKYLIGDAHWIALRN